MQQIPQKPSNEFDPFYGWSVPKLSKRSNLSERTIWRLIESGKLGYHRVNARVIVTEQDWRNMLAATAVAPFHPEVVGGDR